MRGVVLLEEHLHLAGDSIQALELWEGGCCKLREPSINLLQLRSLRLVPKDQGFHVD